MGTARRGCWTRSLRWGGVMADVELVPVREADRAAFEAMAQEHFRALNPAFVPAPDWLASYFPGLMANPEMRVRWVRAGGETAGFTIYGTEPHRFLPRRTGMIYELYLREAFRGRGIATAAARQAIGELREAGVSRLQLEIMEGNEAALRLWTRLGFTKVSERYVLAEG